MNARGVAVASGLGLTLTLGIYSLMGSFGGPFETGHSPVADPLTLNTLKVGVVDAGSVYTHYLANVDGGSVYAPGGVTIDGSKYLTFDGPGGTARITWTGINLALNPGSGKVVSIDGFQAQNTGEFGTLSATEVKLAGSSTNGIISAAAGIGAVVGDAGLELTPVGSGLVYVWGDGLRTPSVGNYDGGGTLALRGDVQVDTSRPVLNLDAGTPRQAAFGGSVTLSGGAGSHNFAPAFSGVPYCTCVDSTATAAVKCSATKDTLTLAGTGTDVVVFLCLGPQ